ncbi:cytochrome b/b6 domain-containing protein [Actimicrobium antarcticum]|uniref:Cytochrome b/b6 domain-containing protein n=1 Tax=Actimicrobium antarcticum TaxID=1051899 RepID=A0ABP7TNE5_9BURK
MSTKNKHAVWDLPIRLMHWALVATVAAAWITSSRIGAAHEYFGYAAAAVVGIRLAWGYTGSRYARFTQFLSPVPQTILYLRSVLNGTASRYLGHNPLGGWMVVAILSCVGLLGITGWLATTEWLWGYAWLVALHAGTGWLLLALIALHVAGVLFTSWQHRENLVAAMVSGKKLDRGDADIT